jgi:HK97 family phage prohead protease
MWFKTATDEAQGIVDAIVNTTSLIDRQKDIVHPGAFRNALAGKMPKVVNSHDGTKFLGKVLSMRELMPGDPTLPVDLRAQGLGALAVTMRFNLETQDGREMFSNIRGGYVDQWSFFFSIEDAQYDAKGIRHIKMIDEIFEVSPVLVGANQATLTLAAKAGRASTAISGYCLKDKQLVRIQNPRAVTMKDGSGATRGSCPHCGTRVYASTLTGIEGARKILRRDAATTAAEQAGKHALWEMWLRGEIGGPVAMPDDIKPQKWPSADGVRHDIRF